jgi:hypothetical protein
MIDRAGKKLRTSRKRTLEAAKVGLRRSGASDFAEASAGCRQPFRPGGFCFRGNNPRAIFTCKVNDFALPVSGNFTVG